MTSTLNLMLILAVFLIFILLSSTRIVRYDLNSKDCPQHIKDDFYKKHPGAKWLFDMKESLDRVNNHIKNEVVVFLKERIKEEQIFKIVEMTTMLKLGQEILAMSYDTLAKISLRSADKYIRKHGVKAANEKFFGDYIENIYYTVFILEEMKSKIINKEEFRFPNELCDSLKRRAQDIRGELCSKN
ncbi:MAG: hypothetical protein II304_06300 [Bacteroidales bacterium]|nr:hypothetical protein [Bacteroidales bacterium]